VDILRVFQSFDPQLGTFSLIRTGGLLILHIRPIASWFLILGRPFCIDKHEWSDIQEDVVRRGMGSVRSFANPKNRFL
jgi:hypothetical protein